MKRFIYLPVLLLLTLLIVACGDSFTSTSTIGPINSPTAYSQSNTTPSIMAGGTFQDYSLPPSNGGCTRPAIDHAGRIWFGEMGHNFLAVLDPHSQKFQQITPPHGRSGIMGVAVASDDTIWFAEQYADYIGHYSPANRHFQTYPLPTLTIPDPGHLGKTLSLPSAPNDLVLDTHGITIDPQGNIWFTEASTSHIGRLDPTTGQISYYSMQGLSTPLMEIAADAHGIIWTTSFSTGLLLSFNPQNAIFTPYYAPSSGGLYGITITPTGQVWVTITAENAIAHLDVTANRFIDYAIPSSGSLPLGVVVGA